MSNPNEEALKKAEEALRESVSRLGNSHPEVYKMLTQYIVALRGVGNQELADRMQLRANALKELLDRNGQSTASDAAAEAAKAAEAARAAEAAKAAAAAEAAKQAELDKKAVLARKAEAAKSAAEQGVFDLDMFEDEDEESMAMALELVKETPAISSKPAQAAAAPGTPQSEEALFLYNSLGKHTSVAYKGGLFTPQGENIGRYLEDYGVFLDRNGSYLGQVVDGDRLGRDLTWAHRHLNFGDRGNEGNRAGWGTQPDVGRTYLDRGWEDVKFGDD